MAWRSRVKVEGRVDAGAVLKDSVAILVRNIVPFGTLTALAFIPVILVFSWMVAITVSEDVDSQTWLFQNLIPFTVIITVVTLICTWALSGTLVYGVYQHIRGRPVRVGDCLTVGLRRLPAVLGTSIIVGLLTAVGLAACFIPGIIVACMLWVALPATVIENVNPIEAIKRSTALTTGTRGSIFAVLFVLGLANKLVEVAVDALLDDAVSMQLGFELTLRLGLLLFFSLWGAVAPAVGYYQLRRSREGMEIDDLAAVFD